MTNKQYPGGASVARLDDERKGPVRLRSPIVPASIPGPVARDSAVVAAPDGQPHVRDELHAGLTAHATAISSKYFYDPLGSRLFDAITRLPEYYLTRTEAGVFSRYIHEIGRIAGRGGTLVDLGAGNCEKAKRLFGVLQPVQYVAVDISAEYLRDALSSLQRLYPGMDMLALGQDLAEPFSLPQTVRPERRLFFYPGSSIGNFTPEQVETFLRGLRAQCGHDGGLLIGVDLVKDKSILDAAYDDALGVTAAFNLNLLNHVNVLLGSDFELRDWRHRAFFNAEMSRVEMHLEARRPMTVTWPGGARTFSEGERIHTENSYKYRLADFEAILLAAGFRHVTAWTDDRQWYAVCHARA
jgi:dimethylhistidine N-methyltransferase